MRTRKIKAGRAYSNGKRVRIVDYLWDHDDSLVDFTEASDGFGSPIMSMELEQFADWASHEVRAKWVKV